ncbi:response regulator transcription factor [Tessaracoccus sp. MC1865]|uniref:LuxR C-terminal-related transcriptional regulator n=1 Tax=unclassified Tessaracoccus TaxID=2635419 RepID=UPI001601AC05|nr:MULTISPECIES: LuxR C-terminal-related transcriptional regulator [unclassified Tessaracoccus]MBB1484012.1 response regulator transcription factor [Tessaracoccus sp. MC1865]MBB1508480.1 response regulator transcription factor [Tessaracoccus sp. MC1756]
MSPQMADRLVAVLARLSPGVVCVSGGAAADRSTLILGALQRLTSQYREPSHVDLTTLDADQALARVLTAMRRLPARRTSAPGRSSMWEPELLVAHHAENLAGREAQTAAAAEREGVTVLAVSQHRLGGALLASLSLGPVDHRQPPRASSEDGAPVGPEQYAAIARQAALHRSGGDDLSAIALLASTYDAARGAVHELEAVNPPMAARLAVDLLPEADRRGDEDIIGDVLYRLLKRADTPLEVKLDGFTWLALIESFTSDAVQRVPRIQKNLNTGVAIAEALGRPEDLLFPRLAEVLTLGVLRDYDRAGKAAADGLEIATRLGLDGWRARFEFGVATIRHVLGDHKGATDIAMSAWQRAEQAGDQKAMIYSALLLGRLPSTTPDSPGGLPALRRALALARDLGDRRLESFTLVLLAVQALSTADPASSAPWLIARYRLVARNRNGNALVPHVLLTLRLAARMGHPRVAARLHGSLLQWNELILGALPSVLQTQYYEAVAMASASLGENEFDRCAEEGTYLSLESAAAEAVDYVLRIANPGAAEAPAFSPPSELTARERDVLRLLVSGHRNKEIAERLVLSPKTVMHHTSAIYRKLGVRGRAEAAVAAVRVGIIPPP